MAMTTTNQTYRVTDPNPNRVPVPPNREPVPARASLDTYTVDGRTYPNSHPGGAYPPDGTLVDGKYFGLVRVKGKTWTGNDFNQTLQLAEPMTKEGVYHVLQAHNPQALKDGLSIEITTAVSVQEGVNKLAYDKKVAEDKANAQAVKEREKAFQESAASRK